MQVLAPTQKLTPTQEIAKKSHNNGMMSPTSLTGKEKALFAVPFLILVLTWWIRPPSPTEQEQIREAVFRHQIEKRAHDFRLFFLYAYVELSAYPWAEEVPLSDRFLQRFVDQPYRVKRKDESHRDKRNNTADKTTGENGLICSVANAKWRNWFNHRAVSVEGGTTYGTSKSFVYDVVWSGGKWSVQEEQMTSIE